MGFLPDYRHNNLLNFNDFVNRTFCAKSPLYPSELSNKKMLLKWF